MEREKSSYFDRDLSLEVEIMHDQRWPRLRTRNTVEVLSVCMAARIIHLLKHKHTLTCIQCHFKEEFNREIDEDTIEAVLDQNFDLTEESLPNGEVVIPTERPAIQAPGYVSGHVLPAGIYWEIINARRYTPRFIQVLVKERWGFTVNQDTIVTALNEWQIRQALSGLPPPDDARPEHDGRFLHELSVHPPVAANDRTSFPNNPPPVYEPRPVFQGLVLRHVREVNPNGSHHYPFFPRGQEPPAPSYTEGASPPSYRRHAEALGSAPLEEPSGSIARTNIVDADGSSEVSTQTARGAGSAMTLATDPKLRDWSGRSIATFSRTNVVDYLFSGVGGKTVYPRGPIDPILVVYRGSGMMRRYMSLAALERQRPLRLTDLFPENVVDGRLNDAGRALSNFTRSIFGELQMSACASSRKVISDFSKQPNLGGLYFTINHMRIRRGAREVAEGDSDRLAQAIVDELRLSDNIFAVMALATYRPEFAWTCQGLRGLLMQIHNRRRATPMVQLYYITDHVSGVPQLAGPGLATSPQNRIMDAAEPALVGVQLLIYRERLKYSRVMLCALAESTSTEGFLMRRLLLEDHIKEAMTAARQGTEAYRQLHNVLNRVRRLTSGPAAVYYPMDWWAAVLTNTSLAISGRFTISSLWMTIPDVPEPVTTASTRTPQSGTTPLALQQTAFIPAQSILSLSQRVSTGAGEVDGLIRPAERNATMSLTLFEGSFRLEYHQQNLHRLRTWNIEIRRWPIDGTVAGTLRREFLLGRQSILLRLHGRELTSAARQEYDAVASLAQDYEHELRILRESFRRLSFQPAPFDNLEVSLLRQHIDQSESAMFQCEFIYASCESSSVSSLLDFTAAESALRQFAWELERVKSWYTEHFQEPLDGDTLDERAAQAEEAVFDLQGERMRLELDADLPGQRVPEGNGEDGNIPLPRSEQIPDEQPRMPSDGGVDVANDHRGLLSSDTGAHGHQQEEREQPIEGHVVFATGPSEEHERHLLRSPTPYPHEHTTLPSQTAESDVPPSHKTSQSHGNVPLARFMVSTLRRLRPRRSDNARSVVEIPSSRQLGPGHGQQHRLGLTSGRFWKIPPVSPVLQTTRHRQEETLRPPMPYYARSTPVPSRAVGSVAVEQLRGHLSNAEATTAVPSSEGMRAGSSNDAALHTTSSAPVRRPSMLTLLSKYFRCAFARERLQPGENTSASALR